MNGRKEVTTGIFIFIFFIVILDALFFYSLSTTLMTTGRDFSSFLTFSPETLPRWIDVLLTVLSLIIIPYGFLKKKKIARFFAVLFLVYAILRTIFFIFATGERTIGYGVFALYLTALLYLFTTAVKKYFKKTTMAIVPVETTSEYTYGRYTLYTELVRLKSGKTQIIYFFSKKTPKSGSPTTLPKGFHVEVSKRSGLPYLKKDPDAFPIPS